MSIITPNTVAIESKLPKLRPGAPGDLVIFKAVLIGATRKGWLIEAIDGDGRQANVGRFDMTLPNHLGKSVLLEGRGKRVWFPLIDTCMAVGLYLELMKQI